MVRFWNPAYQFFTFNQEDMTLTIKEYDALLCVDNVQLKKIYVKEPKPMTFKKKLTKIDLFALAIYGLVIFPKVLSHIEVTVVDFFEKLRQGINPFPTFLAETFRSLSSCKTKREGRFIGCAQLLNAWIFSHFWKVKHTPFHMFSKTFVLLEAYLKKDWPKDVIEQHWVSVFQNLRLWGGVRYVQLMVQRQFALRQFIPATSGLVQSEFAFTGEGYMKKNPFSEEMPSELELARHEFEREKAKLLRDISSFQEENYQLKIDVQIEKSRTEKVQKKAEITRKDLRDLYLKNKKLRGTMRNSGLGKSSTEWKEKLSNIKYGMKFWKGKAKKEEEKAAHAMIEGKIRDLENTLQAHQQHLDDLLRALEEKNGQHNRNILQLLDKVEALSCQFSLSQKSSMPEFLERVRKQGELAKSQQEARDLMVRSREESLEQRDQTAKMMEMMTALVKRKGPMQSPDIMEPQSRANND
ncbi:hypothetical protein Gogos_020884 [Gossypium gossypioides]|uniref:DUF7745 domain-containing protein n=1 Tax=Gossypium gossypioides TaxID=34282 RepID=A0A7J9CWR9_GOSGO|nr:hypothetical protein [Gossypium gossypioides]